MLGDSTPAFAVLWLKDIPDEEEKMIAMQVWKGSKDGIKRAQSCVGYNGMDENEKPLGELKVTMKFWRGLSGYHKGLARRGQESDLKDVMEVLDTANDNKEGKGEEDDLHDGDPDASETSSSSSESEPDTDDPDSNDPERAAKKATSTVKRKAMDVLGGHNDSEDGKRGPSAQLQDYKQHHKSLHRKHRGLMQWKGVRTVDWMMGRASRGKEGVKGVFRHGNGKGETGIETEV